MNRTFLKKSLFYLGICLLIVSSTAHADAKKNDVRPGMSVDDALTVARNCVHAAAGIKKSKIRPGDTLDFLGISNELRIDALRRYIVRNSEIGVQSVWVYRSTLKLSQHFIISNSSLAKVDKTWTVEKLARAISKNAGLPNLTYAKASKIVADARDWTFFGDPEERPRPSKSATPAPEVPPVLASTRILSDFNNDAGKVEVFVNYLQKHEKAGIPSAGITDSAGDSHAYLFSDSIVDQGVIKDGIVNCGWTYRELIDFSYKYAEVRLSPELTAAQLVLSAVLDLLPEDSNELRLNNSARLARADQKQLRIFTFSELYGRNAQIKEDYTLDDLGIDPREMKNKLNELIQPAPIQSCTKSFQITVQANNARSPRKAALAAFIGEDFEEITGATKVGKIIDIVAQQLK